MRILYTGPLGLGSATRFRLEGLIELGYDAVPLDQNAYLGHGPRLLRKIQSHALLGPGIVSYNRALLDLVRGSRPDLIYIDVGSYIWPRTIAKLRESGAPLVHYTSEYLGNRRYSYWYRHFWPAVLDYDVHIVSNKLSRRMLEERGVKKIIMSEFAYDPPSHVRPQLAASEREALDTDFLFIGHWEPTTARMIEALRTAGMKVKVWGHGWWRAWRMRDRSLIRPIPTQEYAKAIACARIGLCFLSKWNQNESSGRTFEIPAIGTFLLAERTTLHSSYFVEGKEAEFFSSPEELIEKARYFLSHEGERDAIARAGHERCLQSGYTYKDRIKHDIEAVLESLSRASAA